MKKRSLFILPLVLAALSACENGGNNSKPYVVPAKDINSMADFEKMVSDNPINSSASKTPIRYSLNVDLDFKNADIHFEIKDVELIGNKHRIKNFTVNAPNYAGLFSKVNNCIISDLTIMNASVDGNYAGALVGSAEIAILKNIKIADTVVVGDSGVGNKVGGVIGYAENAVISGCENNAPVSGMNSVGGVIGHAYNTNVTGCTNNAEITGSTGEGIGGVCGTYQNFWRYEAREDIFESNHNYGDVKGDICNDVGGLIGQHHPELNRRGSKYPKVTIANCINEGTIEGDDHVGGIAGSGISDLCDTTFISCTNQGSVIGQNYVGGIAGFTKDFSENEQYLPGDEQKHVEFSRCSTKLNETDDNFVKGEMYVGGIAGNGTNFLNCTNNIDVILVKSEFANTNDSYFPKEYQHSIGGIVGYGYADFDLVEFNAKYCTNNGKIMGYEDAKSYRLASSLGGICGFSIGGSFIKCNNNGELNAAQCVGGIIGSLEPHQKTYITECNSNGNIVVNRCAGGIIGDLEAGETEYEKILQIGGCKVNIEELLFYGSSDSPESEPYKYVLGGLIGRANSTAVADAYYNIAQLGTYTVNLNYRSQAGATNITVGNVVGYNKVNEHDIKLITYKEPGPEDDVHVTRIGDIE